jgi:hypothetical protein
VEKTTTENEKKNIESGKSERARRETKQGTKQRKKKEEREKKRERRKATSRTVPLPKVKQFQLHGPEKDSHSE